MASYSNECMLTFYMPISVTLISKKYSLFLLMTMLYILQILPIAKLEFVIFQIVKPTSAIFSFDFSSTVYVREGEKPDTLVSVSVFLATF